MPVKVNRPQYQKTRYSTAEEIKFLTKLGTHSNNQNMSRSVLLMKYRQALDLRDDFGPVDKAMIYDAVDSMIHLEVQA